MSPTVFTNSPGHLRELNNIWKSEPVTKPVPVGMAPSFGFGDRVGGATAGHMESLRNTKLDRKVAAIFAQQSAREMMRTGRSPVKVMLDAVQSVQACGWKEHWGADADHMKAEEQVAACLEAGFTWFTADPSEAVQDAADNMNDAELVQAAEGFIHEHQEIWDRWVRSFCGKDQSFDLGNGEKLTLSPTENDLRRVAVKLGRAILRIVEIDCWVKAGWKQDSPYDFEVSVDETASPTSPLEHLVCAAELKHCGVRVTALAPRFVGDFEKAIDYIGSTDSFRANLRQHAAIAKALGPYKISIHSGSDKFSLYPICHEICGSLLHVKTAGTSYLEALRVLAVHEPAAFREVAKFSREVFQKARATYHLSTDLNKVPEPDHIADKDLTRMFLTAPGANDARQVLHVAFGDVLSAANGSIANVTRTLRRVLEENPGDYAKFLADHFCKHLTAFGA